MDAIEGNLPRLSEDSKNKEIIQLNIQEMNLLNDEFRK
jgi:hypothetical protein